MSKLTEEDLRVAREIVCDWRDEWKIPVPEIGEQLDCQSALISVVASAIAAEREKAAKIAEEHESWEFKRRGPDPHYVSCKGCGECIAAAIRAGDRL